MVDLTWNEWREDLFRRAGEEKKLLLLLLVVPWCQYCQALERAILAHEDLARIIERDWIPILVDADRRPDINERYNLGGWPTVAFLTPEAELITGTNYIEPSALTDLLDRVTAFYGENRDEIETNLRDQWAAKEKIAARSAPREGRLSFAITTDVCRYMVEDFDEEYGGWGEGQKFPHPESIDFAMIQYVKTGDEKMGHIVRKTLDNMMDSNIRDKVDGGFFRYSTTRNWQVPHYEKVLDSNAARLSFYMEAAEVFDDPRYLEVARGIVDWMVKFMRDPETDTFYGSMDADPDYYACGPEERGKREPPQVDRTIYTNWNAMAVSALYLASEVLERPDLKEMADRNLQFLLDNLFIENQGMFHYWDGTYHLPGILSDQAYMVKTLVYASQFNGNSDLLLPAENIAETLLEGQRADDGAFYDIPRTPHSIGGLRRRNRSILENAVMAEGMTRLAYLSRREELMEAARETLESFLNVYKEFGYYVAGYARAVDLFLYEPLVVTVVGPREHEHSIALRRAALRTYLPSVLVQSLDPELDPILMGRSGYTSSREPTAYLSVGQSSMAAVHDPAKLPGEMKRVEVDRR